MGTEPKHSQNPALCGGDGKETEAVVYREIKGASKYRTDRYIPADKRQVVEPRQKLGGGERNNMMMQGRR